jgi:hypothetical protein
MPDAPLPALDWASDRRRRWSASRIVAALALHAVVLSALTLAIDRIDLPRHAPDRVTTLVMVALHPVPPPVHALPLPLPRTPTPSPVHAAAPAPRVTPTPAPMPAAPRPREDAQAITLPAPPRAEPAPTVAAAAPAASSPPPDLAFLNNAATRDAIRAVARGDTLRRKGNALTDEAPGSEMVAADGSHTGQKRNLAPPPPAVALANGIESAHKGDCSKGEYLGGGMGLLSAPFLLAAEAMGSCAHKL